MMQNVLVEGIREEPFESETLVSEIIEIMGMMDAVKRKMAEAKSSGDAEGLESLLKTLRIEIVKRGILIARKHGLGLSSTMALANGGGKFKEPFHYEFSRLEEELDKAYRAARNMINNLNRLV
jgi:hypothetical protein